MFENIFENNRTAIFIGNSQSDWGNIAAWDPIDSISLSLKDSPELLINFVDQYTDKFIAGYITYEYGVKQLEVPIHELKGHLPAAHFRVFDSYSKIDITEKNILSNWNRFTPTISKEKYKIDFEKIISLINAGEFYQINYTHSLKSKTYASPRNLFQSLWRKNQVGYSAYIEDDHWAIHSLSPEQFIEIKNGIIITRPIKGTVSRGKTTDEEDRNLKALLTNGKEQAELYMIIDLMRNDLGKVCQTGSVHVLESKGVQKLEKVFHTKGKIKGVLKKEIHPMKALLSMSPGGSISGCPKKRACEMIYDMEKYPRGIYTGSIGYILPDNSYRFNIAIRTVVQEGKNLTLGVGGGITIGSQLEDEFNETLSKAVSFQP